MWAACARRDRLARRCPPSCASLCFSKVRFLDTLLYFLDTLFCFIDTLVCVLDTLVRFLDTLVRFLDTRIHFGETLIVYLGRGRESGQAGLPPPASSCLSLFPRCVFQTKVLGVGIWGLVFWVSVHGLEFESPVSSSGFRV